MRKLILTLLLCFGIGGCGGGDYGTSTKKSSTAGAGSTLNAEAQKLLAAKCASCHGSSAQGGFGSVGDITDMISEGRLVPGSPEQSRIFIRSAANQMPPGKPLTDREKSLMASWILNLYIDSNSAFGKVFNGILQPKCLGCHGPAKASGGVSFETYADTQKTLSPGKPEFSLIYQVVTSGRMPKGKAPLSQAELQQLSAWITAGALR